ncbi:MAG: UDP-N-acetylmuramoyl-L-alanine--D-glutamate ligase, partial [Betaproteobacteria bacterium]|nr:UDP-N-acetylmuramoyl-L-alanine--D-glutamate ligase [Candidatus Dechloromonas phosphorivorans]
MPEAVGVALGTPARDHSEAFTGLPHRVETLAKSSGVLYDDDSKAPMSAPPGRHRGYGPPRVAIVLGGDGKGQDFSPLKLALEKHGRAVALIGRDAAAI